jgi:hypothetical protein
VILKNESKMLKKIDTLINEINITEVKDFCFGRDTAIREI